MVKAYLFIVVKKGGEKIVAEKIRNMTGITDVSELYGEYDIIAKVEKKDMEDLQKFLTNEIRAVDEVERTSTMITVK